MATTSARVEKAAKLIDRVAFTGPAGFFVCASTSGRNYRIRLHPSGEGMWRCNCDWGMKHSYEVNNECSHALAVRYFVEEKEIDLTPDRPADEEDPFEGL